MERRHSVWNILKDTWRFTFRPQMRSLNFQQVCCNKNRRKRGSTVHHRPLPSIGWADRCFISWLVFSFNCLYKNLNIINKAEEGTKAGGGRDNVASSSVLRDQEKLRSGGGVLVAADCLLWRPNDGMRLLLLL